MKESLVRLGLVRDLKAENNAAYIDKPITNQPWSSWFEWKHDKPDVKSPKPLTASDVGPEAP